ncbi:hypothetical protein BGW38_004533 [Lunasporangiospora selenospora]|uniref:Uncharacterized protein n=1 Tax=Lunasporangiospora selenospora TaxID=979761 RepID=A0A9P6FQD2_9FUNG|nr:hypothetical protein BGW38_004533 [Lunasporangiospora selenospora]
MVVLNGFLQKRLEGVLIKRMELYKFGLGFLYDPDIINTAEDGYSNIPIWDCDFAVPLSLNLPIRAVNQARITSKLLFQGKEVGVIRTEYVPAALKSRTVKLLVGKSAIQVSTCQEETAIAFMRAGITEKELSLCFKGTADTVVDFGFFGVHTIEGIPFSCNVVVRCMDSLPDLCCTDLREAAMETDDDLAIGHPNTTAFPIEPVIGKDSFNFEQKLIQEAKPNHLILKGQCQATNVAQFMASSGELELEMWTDSTADNPSQKIGVCYIKQNAVWELGLNKDIPCFFDFNRSSDATVHFLEGLEKAEQRVGLCGYKRPHLNRIQSECFAGLHLSITLPRFSSVHPEKPSPNLTQEG